MKWGKASNFYRSSPSDVFLGKDVKICSKLKGEHPCQAMRAASVFIYSNDIFPLLIVFNGYFYSEKLIGPMLFESVRHRQSLISKKLNLSIYKISNYKYTHQNLCIDSLSMTRSSRNNNKLTWEQARKT